MFTHLPPYPSIYDMSGCTVLNIFTPSFDSVRIMSEPGRYRVEYVVLSYCTYSTRVTRLEKG